MLALPSGLISVPVGAGPSGVDWVEVFQSRANVQHQIFNAMYQEGGSGGGHQKGDTAFSKSTMYLFAFLHQMTWIRE